MTQKKTVQPQITHDHAGHAHVNCPGHAPGRRCRSEVEHLSVSAGKQQLLHDGNLHIHCGELTARIGAVGKRLHTARRNEVSKFALCATRITSSPQNSKNLRTASSSFGAPRPFHP